VITNEPAAAAALPLRVLIADDEAPARWRLKALVESAQGEDGQPLAAVVAEAQDAAEALQRVKAGGIELALLDIQMPGPSGLQLAAELEALPDLPLLVFVTAHSEHALAAFEVQALDYLTKPVARDRLQATLQRARQRWHERLALRRARQHDDTEAAPGEAAALTIAERGRMLRVPLADIVYLKAELKYVTLRTGSRQHVLDESLAEIEARLVGYPFVRVHRNALVARAAMRELVLRGHDDAGDDAAWSLRVAVPGAADEWLTVSRRQLAAVKSALLPP
jgi:two-component system, LytTR family, response regulator AlgR